MMLRTNRTLQLFRMSLFLLLFCSVVAAPNFAAAASVRAVKMVVNGSPAGSAAFLEQNTVMAPMRQVLEAAGATVTWDERSQMETAKLGNHVVKVWMGKGQMEVDGARRSISPAPRLVSNTVFAPIRAVAEPLGLTVVWNEQSATEYISRDRVIVLLCNDCVKLPGKPGHIAVVMFKGTEAHYYSFGPKSGDVTLTPVPGKVDHQVWSNAYQATTVDLVRKNVNTYRKSTGGGAYNWGMDLTEFSPANVTAVKNKADDLLSKAQAGKLTYDWLNYNCLSFVKDVLHAGGVDWGYGIKQVAPNAWANAFQAARNYPTIWF